MSIGTFFKSVEDGAVKIVTFAMKQMTAVEEILGGNTGNAKANIVVTAVEGMLSAMGVPVNTVTTEIQSVNDALAALMKKLGLLNAPVTGSTQPPPVTSASANSTPAIAIAKLG